MKTTTGATARFGAAVVIALGVSLTTAQAQDYADCPAQSVPVKAARDARLPCPVAAQPGDTYLQWAVNQHRAARSGVYLTTQNPVAPRGPRSRDGRICACGVSLSP